MGLAPEAQNSRRAEGDHRGGLCAHTLILCVGCGPEWVRCAGTVGFPWAVGSPWPSAAGAMNTPAGRIILSPLLTIEIIYYIKLGCHSDLLPTLDYWPELPGPTQDTPLDIF